MNTNHPHLDADIHGPDTALSTWLSFLHLILKITPQGGYHYHPPFIQEETRPGWKLSRTGKRPSLLRLHGAIFGPRRPRELLLTRLVVGTGWSRGRDPSSGWESVSASEVHLLWFFLTWCHSGALVVPTGGRRTPLGLWSQSLPNSYSHKSC